MDPKFADEVRRSIEEALKKRGKVNILVAGRSGVGKSTLLNAVFHGEFATTGQGRPVTQEAREYTKEGIPLTILDTRGLEMDRYEETLSLLEKEIHSRAQDPDPKKHLHVAWLCISEDSRRVEAGESKAAAMLARHMPVVGVITKTRADKGFRVEVQRLIPDARNVVSVRAIGEVDDDGNTSHPKGLKELVELTMDLVPEAQRDAFAAAQRVSIELKRRRAHAVVGTSALAAATAGAVPIPFSDAAVIVPIQVGMLAGISAAFGLELNKLFLSTLLSSAGGGLLATLSGQAVVSGLLKLVPGVGTLVGGAIAGATAASITTLFGEAYVAVLSRLFEKGEGTLPTEEEITSAFKEELSGKKKVA